MISPFEIGIVIALLIFFFGAKRIPRAAREIRKIPVEWRRGKNKEK